MDRLGHPLRAARALVAAYEQAGGTPVAPRELDVCLDARALHAAVWRCWFALHDRRHAERATFWLRWWCERLG